MSEYLSRSSRCCSLRRECMSLVHCWSVESFFRSVLLFWHCTALTGPAAALHGTDRAWWRSAKRKERPLRSTRESRLKLNDRSLRGATCHASRCLRKSGREREERRTIESDRDERFNCTCESKREKEKRPNWTEKNDLTTRERERERDIAKRESIYKVTYTQKYERKRNDDNYDFSISKKKKKKIARLKNESE